MKMKSMQFGEVVGDKGLFVDGDWVESKDQDPNGEVRLIQLADIGAGEFLNKSNRRLTMEKAQKLRCTFLEKGDLLVARMPDPIGRTCIFPGGHGPCATVVDVCVVRPDPEIVFVPWLNRVLNTSVFQHEFSKFITGTTRQRISRRNLETTPLVVPPLPEQKRIADILDKADAIRRKRAQALELTDQFLQSVFLDMFGDPVTNPKGWEQVLLGDLCRIRRGGSPRPISAYLGGSVPWIKIGDCTSGSSIYVDHTAERIIKDGVKRSVFLEPGSLIFANCGVSLGFARILRISGCIHDGWLALDDLDGTLNQIYLLKLINSLTHHFRAIAPDGTQPNLNTRIMKAFAIPLPPVALQAKFADIVQAHDSVLIRTNKLGEASAALFESLVQRAFRGKL